MPTKKATKASATSAVSSTDLQGVLKRLKASQLSADDKSSLTDILNQNIKLKKLVEKSKASHGDKKIIASLPGGFDIVK